MPIKKDIFKKLLNEELKKELLKNSKKITLSTILENADLLLEYYDEEGDYEEGGEFIELPDFMWRSRVFRLSFIYNKAYNLLYIPQRHKKGKDEKKWLYIKYSTKGNFLSFEFNTKLQHVTRAGFSSAVAHPGYYDIFISKSLFELVPLKYDIAGVQSRAIDIYTAEYIKDSVTIEFSMPGKYRLRAEVPADSDRRFGLGDTKKCNYIEIILTIPPYRGKFMKRNVSFVDFDELMQKTPPDELKPI